MKIKTKIHFLLSCLITINCFSQALFDCQILLEYEFQAAPKIISADLDGDGDLDIVSGNHNAIIWFENLDGSGSFSERIIIDIDNIYRTTSIFAGDIDNDGDLDLITTSWVDHNTISWYENLDGFGNFGPRHIVIAGGSRGTSVSLIDLNNDGNLDILYGRNSEVGWIENIDGLGSFGNMEIISSSLSGVNEVRFGDLDNDGDMDVICTVASYDELVWFENIDGNGRFGIKQTISLYDYPRKLFVGDIDSDGQNDIICSDREGLYWQKNLSIGGVVSFSQKIEITTDVENLWAIFPDDLDGDGDIDVLIGSSGDGIAAWYENVDGQANFGIQQIIEPQASSIASVCSGDIDGDGHTDVILGALTQTSWFKNNDGEGDFNSGIYLYPGLITPNSVKMADIDNDGDLDFVGAGAFKVAWYENLDGQGTILQKTISSNSHLISSIFTVDLDNDGDIDVLSVDGSVSSNNDHNDKIAWYENLDGLGTFSSPQIISWDIKDGTCVIAADVDNDGDMDVLSTSIYNGKLAWYENIDGNGSFGQQQIINTSVYGALSVAVGDLDNDGDVDVILSTGYSHSISWYENIDGNGDFGNEEILTTMANSVYSVHVSDINGDGWLDIIYCSKTNSKVAWFENINGNGDFSAEQLISSESIGARFVRTGDLDNDGDNDVVVATYSSNQIQWFENINGLGLFGPVQIIYPNAGQAMSVSIADFNNDNDLDIIYSSIYSSKIGLCLNVPSLSITDYIINDISLYPNPTADIINIKSEDYIIELQIYNSQGQLIIEKYNINGIKKIEMKTFNNGIYFLKLQNLQGELFYKKIIKK